LEETIVRFDPFLLSTIADSSPAADSSRDMSASPFANAGAAQPGGPQDFGKLFKAEQDNLEFSEGLYAWVGADVETRILRKYGKIASS
jgi:ER membrane protein complex subunit 3